MLGHTLTHTHTQRQRVSSRLAGGLRVDTAWNIPKQPLPKLQPGKKKTKKKTQFKTVQTLSVCVCLSWPSLAQHVDDNLASRARHQGGT